jgi:hypothetical protein
MPAIQLGKIPKVFSSPELNNVNEVELDLVLTMAISSSPRFAGYLFEKAYIRRSTVDVVGVWRGSWGRVGPSRRESQRDVSVVANCSGFKAGSLLLIENKFVNKFQPEQAIKYREFGDDGLAAGWWVEYRTCLCGSIEFLKNCESIVDWDTAIAFEEVGDWFSDRKAEESIASFMTAMMMQASAKDRKNAKKNN